jgi:LL-diaminopimelate aminotransferase
LPCTEETDFVPQLPKEHADIIYLCSPNNPTGTALTKEQLKMWVDYAREHNSLILYDSAYEAYITQPDVVHSIYEIPGAENVAVEFRSFSKTAGFTGTRCAYTVVPFGVKVTDAAGSMHTLRDLWLRRQTTKFNGVPYIVQRAAEAVYTPQGQAQIKKVIAGYLENAHTILHALNMAGLSAFGGVNAPYIWLKTPKDLKSWDLFEILLTQAQIVGTPGVGFGLCGEGYFRLTAFNTADLTRKAAGRIAELKF